MRSNAAQTPHFPVSTAVSTESATSETVEGQPSSNVGASAHSVVDAGLVPCRRWWGVRPDHIASPEEVDLEMGREAIRNSRWSRRERQLRLFLPGGWSLAGAVAYALLHVLM
jgi:hypothetical protein